MNDQERLNNLIEAIVEDILQAPDEEIIEDIKAAGLDPDETAKKVCALFEEVMSRH